MLVFVLILATTMQYFVQGLGLCTLLLLFKRWVFRVYIYVYDYVVMSFVNMKVHLLASFLEAVDNLSR